DRERRDLRTQIALALFVHAGIGEKKRHHIARDFTLFDDFYWRKPETFLVNLRRERHRTGRHAADVRVMSAIGGERERPFLFAQENRRDQCEVWQVSAASEWIVE